VREGGRDGKERRERKNDTFQSSIRFQSQTYHCLEGDVMINAGIGYCRWTTQQCTCIHDGAMSMGNVYNNGGVGGGG
jgi:hypothetical protein